MYVIYDQCNEINIFFFIPVMTNTIPNRFTEDRRTPGNCLSYKFTSKDSKKPEVFNFESHLTIN